VRHEHGVAQVIVTAGGFNERLVFLAVTIPHDDAHFGLGKNKVRFCHNNNLIEKLRKSSVVICYLLTQFYEVGLTKFLFHLINVLMNPLNIALDITFTAINSV